MLFTDWLCTVIGKLLSQLMLQVSEGDMSLVSVIFAIRSSHLAAENWKERRPERVLAFVTDCILVYKLRGLFDANAEHHRVSLCWSREVKSLVNQGLYPFLVLHFL